MTEYVVEQWKEHFEELMDLTDMFFQDQAAAEDSGEDTSVSFGSGCHASSVLCQVEGQFRHVQTREVARVTH